VRTALLSEEGSTVKTKSRPCEGRFPERSLDKWFLWNHPSRDPLRDPAALLTKEGSLHT